MISRKSVNRGRRRVGLGAGLLMALIVCGGGAQEPSPPAGLTLTLDLRGPWEFAEEGAGVGGWMPAMVPGCVHTDLLANGLIPDPFVGRNELMAQDIENRNWVYRKKFSVSEYMLDRKRIDLICEGLDTIATLRLNGQVIGSSDNMFRRWTGSIRGRLRQGENVLEIAFTSPMRHLDQLRERRFGPMRTANDPIGGSPFLRKAPYQFGWDWAPRLVSCGVWRPVRIIATDAPRIEELLTRQRHAVDPVTGARVVDLEVTLQINSPIESTATLRLELDGLGLAQDVISIPAGDSVRKVSIPVSNPELWWPAGHGAQKLYTIQAILTPDGFASESVQRRIGFRTIRLITRKDPTGLAFGFVVNNRPIFAKGANWIPADSFPERVTEERYRHLLRSAVHSNMNMIRVWGGGIYEDDRFYDLCDELGLLVWQDFMFSCSAYPGDARFFSTVRQEARDTVTRLMNHPSIALYCGNNECETAVRRWFKTESTQWRHYERLFHELLPGVCESLDPDRDYWPSSPHSMEAADPAEPTDGDTHVWSVWHGARPFEEYQTIKARFVSEFGFQSFPSMNTLRALAGGGDLNLTAAEVSAHQKNAGGNKRILTQMLDRFRMPNDFESFVVLSQLQQALAMQMAVEHWRRSAPLCMGTLYWQLNDCWPAISWSSIDYYGRWKALQYFARRFYEPFHVSAATAPAGAMASEGAALETDSDDSALAVASGGAGFELKPVTLHATCDVARETTFTLNWALQTYRGVVITSGTQDFRTTDTTAVKVVTVSPRRILVPWYLASDASPYTPENTYLTFRATDGTYESRGVHHFASFKDLDLPRPDLKVTTRTLEQGVEVTVSTDVFAKWVWLEARGEKKEGHFMDNYFDLDPGETRSVLYLGPPPASFVAKSLTDTYR